MVDHTLDRITVFGHTAHRCAPHWGHPFVQDLALPDGIISALLESSGATKLRVPATILSTGCSKIYPCAG